MSSIAALGQTHAAHVLKSPNKINPLFGLNLHFKHLSIRKNIDE